MHEKNKPDSLNALDAKGFVNDDMHGKLGLVFNLPEGYLPTTLPTSLFSLLDRPKDQPRLPFPSFERRYQLATSLSESMYVFMSSRWYHKRFSSRNVFFLSKSAHNQTLPSIPDLKHPLVCGFSVSRQDDPKSESLETAISSEDKRYFHPSYKPYYTKNNKEQKYKRAFDIYAFGVLLAEIGFWGVLKRIVSSKSLEGEDFRKALINKCKDDLSCWTGERYLAVTLRCLTAESMENGSVGEELSDFYWDVVLELTKCCVG